MTTAKTTAERQRELKARRAALGITRCAIWAHRDDHAALKAYARELAARRELESKDVSGYATDTA